MGVRVRVPAAPATRGRTPGYTAEQIAAAAVAIADEYGMDAVSMRKVATALGTGAMSLYRYVKDKDDLCQLMLDHVVGELDLPEPTGDWRADLRTVARTQRASRLAHPWLAAIAAGRPVMGPNMLRLFEYGLSTLAGLGLPPAELAETYALVSTWVNGFVQEELAERDIRAGSGLSDAEWQAGTASYLDGLAGTPLLAAIVRDGVTVDADARFERGLDRIIAGIAATSR